MGSAAYQTVEHICFQTYLRACDGVERFVYFIGRRILARAGAATGGIGLAKQALGGRRASIATIVAYIATG